MNRHEQLHFTTRVLGPSAAYRLELRQVTQTLRSESDSIANAILLERVSAGDKLEITLDGRLVGRVELVSMDVVTWKALDVDDARRGGFGNRFDLGQALQRAGFRFMPLNDYQLFRIQFRWLEETYA
ncbi:unnamed protein product [marine sediment metagenome]|uniref:ASCH domain-containing protein n=1 Tax=marine sediment metagenome TaxID=412755 RepID=X1S4A0_9ZZZZ